MTRVYKNSTFEVLSNQFETIGELKVSNGDVLDDTLTESLDTGFFTSEFTVVKKNPIVRAITLDSYLIRHTKEGERVLLSLYEVMNEDSEKKDVRYEGFVVKFIQDETQEIEMPRQSQPISYYLERSLEGTPIVLGTVETSESKYLEYRKTKRATRLLDIYQDFEVVPHYRTVFKSGSHAPDYVELNIMKRRGMKTDIRLDSKINLLEAEYSSNKGSLITAVEVIPFEKEEKSTVKENTVVQAVEAKPKSTPKATVTTPTSSGGKPAWPTTAGLPITTRYGRRSAPLPGSSSLHGAIDIGGNGRTHPIYATQDAVVHAVGTYNNGGIYVILKHTGDQYYSRYLHLQSYSVSKGQTVKKGQRIATMGTTGPSTGIHLDFAISKNGQFPFNSLSHTINPETYLQTNFPAVALGTRSLSAAARPAGMGHRTAMQLDYLRKQQGGTYTQSSARNNWTPEPASADCSSIVYKSLIAAGIPCGFNRGDWLGTTYTIKRDTENKKYFYRISWASLEPGDIILCNNYGHVVTYMGDGKVFHASKPGTPHGYSDLSYYKPRHNMVCRPNIRGTVTVGKPKTTDTDRPAASTTTKTYSTDNEYRDEVWLWLKRLGATDIHAAATMGNIREEVGATFSPHVDQIGGPGRGLFQWTQGGAYDRWTPVVNWIRSQGGNPRTVEWQIKAYHWELTKTWESDNINNNVVRYGGQKRSTGWDSLNTVTNLNQATDLICVHFERPAVKPQPVRRSHAKQVHNIYKGTYDNIQLPDDEPPKKTASQKTTTTSREVTRMITYDIKHIDYNQDGIISNPRSNLIFDQESQQKYGFNSPGEKIRIQDAYYPKAYYEMRSEDIENEFQKALALLKENSRPKEEYKVTLFEEVKGLNIGDGVTVISHNWDIGRPLIVEADVSEYVWSETDEDNRQIVLANYKRITPEIPAAVRRAQEQINAMSDIEQLNFNISLSSTNGNVFTGMHDETIIESSLTYQGIELKEMVDERLFVWQLFNKDGSVVDTDQPKDIVADMPVVNNSDRTVTIQSGNLVDGSRYRYHLTNPSAIFSFEIYDTTNEIIMDSEVFDASEDVYFTAPENAAYAEITLYNSNGRDIEMWSEPKPLQMFTRDLVVDTDMVNEGTTVTLAVHQQFASINISKADYTQTGSIPPSNSRPGSEFLKEVPGTGFYDGNGNWTGNYEKIMYDGHEWVNQDVTKLEKELEKDFFELDESLKERDEKQQAILDGLGVKSISETDAQIRADIQEFIASQPPSENMEIVFEDGSTTTWANFKGDYKQVTKDVGMFRSTLGSTEEEIASGITGTVSDVIQSSDIIQASVGKALAGERKGMIGDVILENSNTQTLASNRLGVWYLSRSLIVGSTYYARMKATIQPTLFVSMADEELRFSKVSGTTDEWELFFEYSNGMGEPTHVFYVQNKNSAAGQFQILELYESDPEAIGTILSILSNSGSIRTQNLIGDTLAELGIINSDGYFSGDRFMFNSDVKIANDFKLQANHIQGNIMELTTASFVAEDGTTYIDPYRVESYAPSDPLKAYPRYRTDKMYRARDMVYHNGRVYRAKQDSKNKPPFGTSNAHWNQVWDWDLEEPPHPGALASMQNGTFFTRAPNGNSMGYLGYLNRNGKDYYALNVSASRNFGIVTGGTDVVFEYADYNKQLQAGRNLSFNSGYGVIQSSDRRLKYDVEPTEVNPEKILEEAEFSSFTYNDSDIHLDIGMVAQDNMDLTVEGEDGYLAIDTMKLNYVTAYAVQRLLKRVKELEEQLG